MQFQKYSILALFCVLFLCVSCKKENEEETWFYYDQTKCADIWDQYLINVPSLEGVIEYHFSEFTEITVDEIDIDVNGGEAQDCEACSCTTGTRIRVRADMQFQADMEEQGFMLE